MGFRCPASSISRSRPEQPLQLIRFPVLHQIAFPPLGGGRLLGRRGRDLPGFGAVGRNDFSLLPETAPPAYPTRSRPTSARPPHSGVRPRGFGGWIRRFRRCRPGRFLASLAATRNTLHMPSGTVKTLAEPPHGAPAPSPRAPCRRDLTCRPGPGQRRDRA